MRRPFCVVLAATLALGAGALVLGPRVALAQVVQPDPIAGNTSFASDPDGAVAQARRSVASGDLPGATKHLAQYVSAHPRELAPARYLGDLYYRDNDLRAAERTYVRVLTFAPHDTETHDRLGGVYAAQDRVADAIQQFQDSLPESSAYGHLVELHRRFGDLDRFERNARDAAESAPNDATAQYAIGAIYRAENRPNEAIPYLLHTLSLDGGSCPVLSELGSAYLDLLRFDEAQKTLERCLATDPDNYAANVNIGDVFIERARPSAARAVFERANRVRPDAPEALVDLGYVEDLNDKWDSAVRFYLRAIGVDPLARDAYLDLGYDYHEHRLFALAEAAYLKGLSVSPADGRLHYLLGVTYADQGKRDLARAEYRRAAASDDPIVVRAASLVLTTLQ